MASPSQRRRLRISAATVAVLTVTLAAIGLSRSLTDRASTEGSPVSIVLANPGPSTATTASLADPTPTDLETLLPEDLPEPGTL